MVHYVCSAVFLPVSLCYIAVGMAIATVAISIGSNYLKRLHYFGQKLKNAGLVKIWFGGKK